jgi:DNA repair protein RadA/Sms
VAKIKSIYVCQNCGADSPKWIGRCTSCGQWNTYVEEILTKNSGSSVFSSRETNIKPEKLNEISVLKSVRIDSRNNEFNRVLGGGFVPGSLILIGGEPGIGKSTLVLQIALKLDNLKVLYVSGEESGQQLRMRAERLAETGSKGNPLIYTETSLENILTFSSHEKPEIIIIDSIQTLTSENIESSAGSVSQVRECATRLLKFAKETHTPVILIGHITKDGSIAGPKVLEHIVDVVLQFEGDTHYMFRILRSMKNRFGSTSEIGVYEMESTGLKEVSNPSEIFIGRNSEKLSGIAITATMEGIRPLLIEVQALVSSAAYGTPQRSATGFDLRRLNMLLAVLEKRANFKLISKDVFLNIAGGIRVDDPSTDLGVISAILSSTVDIAIDNQFCFAGEISLSGEVRPVNRLEQRIMEAEKLGFRQMIVSRFNKKSAEFGKFKIEITYISKVQQIPKILFG